MNRRRPWLSAVLGLLFLVQGFAVAAAQLPSFGKDDVAAAQAASMPCHGDVDSSNADTANCSCCGDDCPGMDGCAMGQVALVAAPPIAGPLAHEAPPVALLLARASYTPQFLLRPPIAFHG